MGASMDALQVLVKLIDMMAVIGFMNDVCRLVGGVSLLAASSFINTGDRGQQVDPSPQ